MDFFSQALNLASNPNNGLFAAATSLASNPNLFEAANILLSNPNQFMTKMQDAMETNMEKAKQIILDMIALYCIKVRQTFIESAQRAANDNNAGWWGFKGVLYNTACPKIEITKVLDEYKEYLIETLVQKNIPFLNRDIATKLVNIIVVTVGTGQSDVESVQIPQPVAALLSKLNHNDIRDKLVSIMQIYAKKAGTQAKEHIDQQTATFTGLNIRKGLFNSICKPVYIQTITNFNQDLNKVVNEEFPWFYEIINSVLEESLKTFTEKAFSGGYKKNKKKTKKGRARKRTRKLSRKRKTR
jgi:hypothetical protein